MNKNQSGGGMPPEVLNRAYQQVDDYDLQVITDIVDRYLEESSEVWPLEAKTDMIGRLVVCHTRACPLDLIKLLDAESFDLSHDVIGLYNHLDPHTGQILHHWVPRCALF